MRYRLLVVDDDADILAIVTYTFENIEDIEVKTCRSGEEALREVVTFLPHVILLDVLMPKMNGFLVLQALRQMPACAKTPVLFFTARLQPDELERYRAWGVDDIIMKPFDPSAFVATIRGVMQKYGIGLSSGRGAPRLRS